MLLSQIGPLFLTNPLLILLNKTSYFSLFYPSNMTHLMFPNEKQGDNLCFFTATSSQTVHVFNCKWSITILGATLYFNSKVIITVYVSYDFGIILDKILGIKQALLRICWFGIFPNQVISILFSTLKFSLKF